MKPVFSSLILAVTILLGCVTLEKQKPVANVHGIYKMCLQVSGYSGETLELKNGSFRYWFYSDVGVENLDYPLTGRYMVRGNKLSLQHKDIYSSERTISSVNGQPVIWREDGLEQWRKEKRIRPYAVLIRVPGTSVDDPWSNRPSIALLYDQQMIQRKEREYEERYSDLPEPLRSILRAEIARDDPDLKAFKAEIRKVRANLDSHILRQLISRMGNEDSVMAVSANFILGYIYESDHWLILEAPLFMNSEETFHESLNLLVDAMSEAKDRSALEKVLILFLRVSKVGIIDLPVPEAGIRIRITAEAVSGYTIYGDDHIPGSKKYPKDYTWVNEIGTISQACQDWCRSQIESLKKEPNQASETTSEPAPSADSSSPQG